MSCVVGSISPSVEGGGSVRASWSGFSASDVVESVSPFAEGVCASQWIGINVTRESISVEQARSARFNGPGTVSHQTIPERVYR